MPPENYTHPYSVVAHFLRQVESHHVQTPNHTPLPLHYDSKTGSMAVFPWYVVHDSFVNHSLTRTQRRPHK
jgi:hypothetical protein